MRSLLNARRGSVKRVTVLAPPTGALTQDFPVRLSVKILSVTRGNPRGVKGKVVGDWQVHQNGQLVGVVRHGARFSFEYTPKTR